MWYTERLEFWETKQNAKQMTITMVAKKDIALIMKENILSPMRTYSVSHKC